MARAHDAVLSFTFEDERRARTVERSVRPEVGAIAGDRTTATLDREAATVTVTVEADDLVALRAGINTWSTLVSVGEAADAAGCGSL
ncbi:KEOPS complex subunit Pcc1 [Halorientalis regularis]|uniref:KEOPS complex subunit Pcc1 n=1 Tax=Halorientalis regularis TaxID=660518 RepID=A0A1G7J336_9EURY|nr:KEOPS complex subunit Pcc1 [Halorientalis regularis]SDF19278.1 KEOPS complex subunit Pcc1 [Halorientalis regularis]